MYKGIKNGIPVALAATLWDHCLCHH